MQLKNFFFIFCFFLAGTLLGQQETPSNDAFFIRSIYDQALTNGQAYDWLTFLSEEIGGRLSGSPEAAAAVEYTRQVMDTLGMDSIWLQPCQVPHWSRGEREQVRIVNSSKMGTVALRALALGNSIGTGPAGLAAEVVEVKSLEEVDSLGRSEVEGRIVFYNGPMDPTQINTFNAYGGAAGQRVYGASKAAKYGAVAVLVRSLTNRIDTVPHTGVMIYRDEAPQIPAIAISTMDAELLSRLLQEEPVRVFMRNTSKMLAEKTSYNVIGEIRGSTHPEEIILVGGHLDSWDVGGGAHDDGAGCVHSLDVIHILKRLGYQPNRTIRCVMFMNEENGQYGAQVYQKISDENGEYHLAAIESDRGGFTPRGFSCDADERVFNQKFKKLTEWLPLLEPYGLTFKKGGSGADISRLKPQKGMLIGFMPDSQRYFDYHHTPIDHIQAVNKRELHMGVAAMTSLVYLLDKYGLDE
ncbi:MAG: M28 family peptidase [Bacteroidota bacterium]